MGEGWNADTWDTWRIDLITEMIWWTGLAPCEFEFLFPDSFSSTFLDPWSTWAARLNDAVMIVGVALKEDIRLPGKEISGYLEKGFSSSPLAF